MCSLFDGGVTYELTSVDVMVCSGNSLSCTTTMKGRDCVRVICHRVLVTVAAVV